MKKNEALFLHTLDSPLGVIRLYANEEALVGLYLEKEKVGKFHGLLAQAAPKKTKILNLAEKELKLYFAHQLNQFTVPLQLFGTPFQIAVWKGLRKIKSGTLRTYGEFADQVASKSAIRAVSSAIGSNPISIVIPCHRVVGATGKLTGYAGGLSAKAWLLLHEGHTVKNEMIIV